jgi:hypothetical protein
MSRQEKRREHRCHPPHQHDTRSRSNPRGTPVNKSVKAQQEKTPVPKAPDHQAQQNPSLRRQWSQTRSQIAEAEFERAEIDRELETKPLVHGQLSTLDRKSRPMIHSPVERGLRGSTSPASVGGHPDPGPGELPGADPTRSRRRRPKAPDPTERSSGHGAPTGAPPPRKHQPPPRQRYGRSIWRRGEPGEAKTPQTRPQGAACPTWKSRSIIKTETATKRKNPWADVERRHFSKHTISPVKGEGPAINRLVTHRLLNKIAEGSQG